MVIFWGGKGNGKVEIARDLSDLHVTGHLHRTGSDSADQLPSEWRRLILFEFVPSCRTLSVDLQDVTSNTRKYMQHTMRLPFIGRMNSSLRLDPDEQQTIRARTTASSSLPCSNAPPASFPGRHRAALVPMPLILASLVRRPAWGERGHRAQVAGRPGPR